MSVRSLARKLNASGSHKRRRFQPSRLRYHINKDIMQHCKVGDLRTALRVYQHEMVKQQIRPNTYTLFALLIGCRESNNLSDSNQIWNDLVIDRQIEADFNCYQIMIGLLAKQHKTRLGNNQSQNSHFVQQLIHEYQRKLQQEESASFTAKEWYILLHSLSVMGNVEQMMNAYHTMKMHGVALNSFILTCLFEGIIDAGKPKYLEQICRDILDGGHNDDTLLQMIDHRVLQSFLVAVCRMCRYFQFETDLLVNMWNLAVKRLNIEIDTHCYCIAILTLSKFASDKELEILHELISEQPMLQRVEIDSIGFRQILTAFGNLGMFDKMWSVYNEAVIRNGHRHDIDALITISQFEHRNEKLMHILDTVRNAFDWEYVAKLPLYSIIGLYRISIKCRDNEFKCSMLKILNLDQNKADLDLQNNIVAYFQLDGKQWMVENGIDEHCPFQSNEKVDRLMQETQYVFADCVCNEIFSENARSMHLKYHAEKKAVSILLFETSKEETVTVSVSIAMCSDCHKFFAEMSSYCQRIIQCVDPNGIHSFQNGHCSLCDVQGL